MKDKKTATDTKNLKISFLFGAGASIDAGVASTAKITNALINFSSYCHSDDSKHIENLLRYIQVKIADHMNVSCTEINFEYILGTLVELSNRGDYPIAPLLGEGDALIRKLEKITPLKHVVDRLYALLREMLYIRKSIDYLNPLQDMLEISTPLDLFTLNYDLSLENTFENLGIPYTTGFKEIEGKMKTGWVPDEFKSDEYKARIYKLHGSVNWGDFYHKLPPPKVIHPEADVIRAARDYFIVYPEVLQFNPYPIGTVEPPDRKHGMVSVMNFGTRKETLYASSQFNRLFHEFYECLKKTDILITAGYSFQDARINKFIEEVVSSKEGKLRLVILDPNANQILNANPLLFYLQKLNIVSTIRSTLAEALEKKDISEEIKTFSENEHKYSQGFQEYLSPGQDEIEDALETNPEKIKEFWRALLMNADLLSFWCQEIFEELSDIDYNDKNNSKEIGHLLLPIVRKIRDLCHHIDYAYKLMSLGGTYDIEELSSINIFPKFTGNHQNFEKMAEGFHELWANINVVYNTCHGATEEFIDILDKEDFTAQDDIPNAELVIRDVTSRIYELAAIFNDVYIGLGYEEPFKVIADGFKSE